MARIFAVLLVLAAVIGGLGYVFRADIALILMKRVASRNLSTDTIAELPDGLHIALCGAGSPLPDPRRHGPCSAVIAGERMFIVDSGSGSARVLNQMQFPPARVERVFITHFHSDHIDGLGELMTVRWAGGSHEESLVVVGPDGVEQVVDGFNTAYAQDRVYRVEHHGEAVVPPSGGPLVAEAFPEPLPGQGLTVFEEGDLTVTAFVVDHFPVKPAVGYRFDYKGRSLLISGDTKKDPNLTLFAKDVDLLVHEALSPRLLSVLTDAANEAGQRNLATITVDILDYHTSPVEAAEVAAEAGADHLLFYHIVPAMPLSALDSVFTEGVTDVYSGPVTVGRDGTMISLPAGSAEIITGSRL